MRKAFTILIAAILLASGMQVSIDRHYCGGSLAGVKISVTGKLASCGMEQSESDCGNHPNFGQKCCEDQITSFTINSNYYPEYFKLIQPLSDRNILLIQAYHFISFNSYDSDSEKWVLPPGADLKSGLTQPEICVFRI